MSYTLYPPLDLFLADRRARLPGRRLYTIIPGIGPFFKGLAQCLVG